MSEQAVLLAIALAAASGVPGLLFGRHSAAGQWLATLFMAGAALLGFGAAALALAAAATSPPLVREWSLPVGQFRISVDNLSVVFLVPVFLIGLLGSVYGHGYWKQAEHVENGRKLRLFYGLMTAAMALLVVAQDAVLFLIAWEVMALSAFFLVTTEDQKEEVRAAGWVYLLATHVATLCLFGLFGIWRWVAGSFALTPLPGDSTLSPGLATALFVLALVGFGLKAGIMPLHVWLPSAHANAPSHVSAVLSGVLIKMGIYGLVRVLSLFPHPPLEWGVVLLGLGVVSGVLGVAFAIGQHDLKRLLAYHSIENIGIIVMGLGLALIGRAQGRTDWVILGLSGALLHVWNHAFFKGLLFLGAGSVIHATHTREIDRLGGLARTMPWTSLCFLVGAVAICGLPPLNGFVSEFLIYLGLFGTLLPQEGSFPGAAFAAPALALIGALAVACFVKVFGAVFLGTARSEHGQQAHESPPSMIGPMGVLVACCFLIGLAPALLAPLLGKAVTVWAPETEEAAARLATLAPLNWISLMGALLLAALGAGALLLRERMRLGVAEDGTWGCGYVAPTPRMQYTASSFAQMLVDLFAWVLRPQTHAPHIGALFPAEAHFETHVPDTVLDRVLLPAARGAAWLATQARRLQQGRIQTYLIYIFLTLLALLLWR
jgi:hydrogenase-4 component B